MKCEFYNFAAIYTQIMRPKNYKTFGRDFLFKYQLNLFQVLVVLLSIIVVENTYITF